MELFFVQNSRILKTLEEDGTYGTVLRAKGMVAGADGEWIYFDMVPQEHEVRSGAAEYTGRICVIGSTYGTVLRAKGMVAGADGEWIYFDMVPQEHEVRSGAAEYTGRICVIGSRLEEDKLEELFGLKK